MATTDDGQTAFDTLSDAINNEITASVASDGEYLTRIKSNTNVGWNQVLQKSGKDRENLFANIFKLNLKVHFVVKTLATWEVYCTILNAKVPDAFHAFIINCLKATGANILSNNKLCWRSEFHLTQFVSYFCANQQNIDMIQKIIVKILLLVYVWNNKRSIETRYNSREALLEAACVYSLYINARNTNSSDTNCIKASSATSFLDDISFCIPSSPDGKHIKQKRRVNSKQNVHGKKIQMIAATYDTSEDSNSSNTISKTKKSKKRSRQSKIKKTSNIAPTNHAYSKHSTYNHHSSLPGISKTSSLAPNIMNASIFSLPLINRINGTRTITTTLSLVAKTFDTSSDSEVNTYGKISKIPPKIKIPTKVTNLTKTTHPTKSTDSLKGSGKTNNEVGKSAATAGNYKKTGGLNSANEFGSQTEIGDIANIDPTILNDIIEMNIDKNYLDTNILCKIFEKLNRQFSDKIFIPITDLSILQHFTVRQSIDLSKIPENVLIIQPIPNGPNHFALTILDRNIKNDPLYLSDSIFKTRQSIFKQTKLKELIWDLFFDIIKLNDNENIKIVKNSQRQDAGSNLCAFFTVALTIELGQDNDLKRLTTKYDQSTMRSHLSHDHKQGIYTAFDKKKHSRVVEVRFEELPINKREFWMRRNFVKNSLPFRVLSVSCHLCRAKMDCQQALSSDIQCILCQNNIKIGDTIFECENKQQHNATLIKCESCAKKQCFHCGNTFEIGTANEMLRNEIDISNQCSICQDAIDIKGIELVYFCPRDRCKTLLCHYCSQISKQDQFHISSQPVNTGTRWTRDIDTATGKQYYEGRRVLNGEHTGLSLEAGSKIYILCDVFDEDGNETDRFKSIIITEIEAPKTLIPYYRKSPFKFWPPIARDDVRWLDEIKLEFMDSTYHQICRCKLTPGTINVSPSYPKFRTLTIKDYVDLHEHNDEDDQLVSYIVKNYQQLVGTKDTNPFWAMEVDIIEKMINEMEETASMNSRFFDFESDTSSPESSDDDSDKSDKNQSKQN